MSLPNFTHPYISLKFKKSSNLSVFSKDFWQLFWIFVKFLHREERWKKQNSKNFTRFLNFSSHIFWNSYFVWIYFKLWILIILNRFSDGSGKPEEGDDRQGYRRADNYDKTAEAGAGAAPMEFVSGVFCIAYVKEEVQTCGCGVRAPL